MEEYINIIAVGEVIEVDSSDILPSVTPYLTQAQSDAIKALIERDDIVFKPVVKGDAIFVRPVDKYIRDDIVMKLAGKGEAIFFWPLDKYIGQSASQQHGTTRETSA